MASVVYNSWKSDVMKGTIDHVGDTIRVALVTSSYSPDIDAHTHFDDVTDEVVGTGYTAGGAALASQAVTQDNTDDEGVFDAADTTWSSSTITARGAVLYKDTGTPSTSPLIGYFDFGSDKVSTGGNFTIAWNSEGLLNVN